MKKVFLVSTAVAALAMVGCSNENDLLLNESTQEVFSGEIVTASSRTSLGENGKVLWSTDDPIKLFKSTGYYQKYKVKNGGTTSADFVYDGINQSGAELDQHYAVYPYEVAGSIDAETKIIDLNLASLAEQTYQPNTFDATDAVMVAKSENTTLPFTNTLAIARVNLNIGGAVMNATVTSVKFTSTGNALTGDATVDMSEDKPAVVITGSGKEITLNATSGVTLSEEPTPFYIMMPAGVYEEGTLKLTINAVVNRVQQTCEIDLPALTLSRSIIKTINKTFTEDNEWQGTTDGDDIILPNVVSTAKELAECLTADKKDITVELANDIDLPISSLGQQTGGSGEYKLGSENTKNIIIDLNGKKLNVTTTYWSNLGAKNADALFTIKNGTMTSSQASGTWNSYDLCFSNCNYVIENVVFDKAIALVGANKEYTLKNVTINETHDYYAIWISAKGQNVTVDGLTINSLGRGIKIDEQYVDAPAKVTLNISNATFKTTKKAAILVKSVAGAEINASNLNLSEVTEDKGFAVWVDEEAKDNADLVVVNGAQVKVEGDNTKVTVETKEGLSEAISAGATTINLVAGEYTLPAIANNVAISGSRDVVVTVNKPNMGGKDLTLQGVTVKASGYATGVQHVNSVTYNNVKIIGEMCLYGENVVFNNCEFELNNQYVWTYGAKNAEFNNCVFNTNGKAILVYNEGAGTNNVKVNGCTFNATAGAKAGAIANQNCAAIEIDNFQSSGTGAAHKVTTSGNTFDSNFSGEWRIKNYVNGNSITVNGVEYTSIALDGKTMTIDANKNVTVNE